MKGYIHSFESLAALDGEGLRYGVFMQGCPLRCVYCHNPDTWGKGGMELSAEELAKKVCRYKPYFKNGGGVTFSGGEPLLQAEFLKETTKLLAENDVNYIIDTSGCVRLSDNVRYLLENAHEVLLDLKFWDNESYAKYTGADMSLVLKFFDFLEEKGIRTVVRTVIVPGINDSEEVLERYLKILEGKSFIERYELLAFHTMGFFKYEKLGLKNPLSEKSALPAEVRDRLQAFVNEKIHADNR